MKIASLLATMLLCAGSALTSHASWNQPGQYGKDISSDMALIYAGGTQRPDWTPEELEPYVVHTYADGHQDWLFDSFLFLEFNSGKTNVAFGNGNGKTGATRTDLEWLMDRQFAKGRCLDALDSIIGIYKEKIGEPRLRHKVVLGIACPVKAQRNWGIYGSMHLDMNSAKHREYAALWSVEQLIKRFNEANYDNIDLAGFYWTEEALYTNGEIVPVVNDYIYRRNYISYWIPYFSENPHKYKWRDYGFDVAYLQPNYFFDRSIPRSRLKQACKEAKANGMAVEFEFETQGKSKAQHGIEDSYYTRLIDYIDAFEKNGVFKESSVAWYSGTKGFLDMARSTDPMDHKAMDRIADIVAKRQKAKMEQMPYPVNQIRDLALIYQGASYRLPWTKDNFVPYVTHTFADGTTEWLYDGYLFLDFGDGGGAYFTPRAGYEGARKKDWEWYLGRLFEKGKSLDALDKCIDEQKQKIGDPGFRHKIVLTMLTPIKGLKEWGEVDGRMLDFNNEADMLAASDWFINRLIEGFEAGNYKNLELTGIYWLDEDLCHTGDLSGKVGDLVHKHGLEYIWIPYFKSRGYMTWKDMGFDIAYMQPNYFFHEMNEKRLDEACDFARRFGLAMEFEADGDALSQKPESKADKMDAYVEAFERNGVWNNCAVAHYTGSNLLVDFVRNPSPENQAVADRYCRKIVDRQKNARLTPKGNRKKNK